MTDKKNPTLSAVWDLWREVTRPEIIITIEDIISAIPIQNKEGMKPIVCHHNPTKTGWHVVLNIPAGLDSEDITHWLNHFEEHLGAYIEVDVNENKVHLNIYTVPLNEKEVYAFNPEWFKGMDAGIPIGIAYTGPVVCDLSRLPHLFLAGCTGSGKTTEIKVIIDALLRQNVIVRLIDLKGLDFAYLDNHIQIAEELKDAADTLSEIRKEMKRRVKLLRSKGCYSWHDYKGNDLPYMVLVIDELGELTDKEAQKSLESLVRLCRAAGISIVAATQRPSAKLWKNGDFREVISLFDARICYRAVDGYNSEIVLGRGNKSAYDHIKLKDRGRGIWKCDGETLVQSMYIPNPAKSLKDIPVVKKHDPKPAGDAKPDTRFKPK